MKREYYHWHSSKLDRTMEMLVFGHAGARVLAFPPRLGRFYQYEDKGLIEAIRPMIDQGHIQVFCVDSIDADSVYCDWISAQEKIRRHLSYEDYILQEVLPLTEKLGGRNTWLISFGCSLGAWHAMNIALRHPHYFNKVVALSGRYDLTNPLPDFTDLMGGFYDESVYFNTPSHYLPNMPEGPHLDAIRKLEITLAIGDEDPFFQNNLHLSETMWSKGIWHAFHQWDGRAHRFRYWRQMARHYL